MILNWCHRKLVEILLDFPRGTHYNPKVNERDKNEMETEETISSTVNGHRYRYYIPQVNITEQLANITDNETNSKSVEAIIDKYSNENGHENKISDLKSANHKIRKLLVIPMGSERSTEHCQIVQNGTIREIYPMVHRFYVLPVKDGHKDIPGSKQIEFESKWHSKQEDEDSNLISSDIFDDDTETPFESVMSPRDLLLNKQLMEYDSSFITKEKNKLDEEPFGDEVNFKKEISNRQDELFDPVCLSDGWWSNLDFDYPISHKKSESRLVDPPKAQKSFMASFKNLFVRENEADGNN